MQKIGIGLGLDVSDLVSNANTAKNSIESVGRALDAALKSGDINSVKDYAQSSIAMRGQFMKDATVGGYSDIKLDVKDLEGPIKQIKDLMERMISEGKPKEAAQYSSLLNQFQHQRNSEIMSPMEEAAKAEKDRETSLLRSIRGISRSIGGGANIIGQAGAGNVAGAALGAAGGIGDLLSQLPKGALLGGAVVGGLAALAAGANKLSEQWEKVMQPSMALAASMGRLSDDADKNHFAFQEVFSRATDRRVLHGYEMEEGIELANRLSKTGMAADNVIGGEEQVFRYQRVTDADRGSLAQAVGYAGRYRNNENVLGYAFGGVKASGMEQGQYQEYLNATLRIFEEGLSKGVVKGFAEITRAQNMLAYLGDTWKGEQGAERILKMEDAITGAGSLQSDYDVIMYRAAQEMMKNNKALGDSGNYLDVTSILEQGITAGNGEILRYVHEVVKGISDTADEQAMLYKKIFSLNTDAARELQKALETGALNEAKAVFADPKSIGVDETPEGKLLSATAAIKADVAKMGAWFTGPKANIVDAISRLTGAMAGNKIFESYRTGNIELLESMGLADNEINRLNRLFTRAYTEKNQPDADNNLMGDYGENAAKMQDMQANLPIGVKYQIANNPRLQRTLFSQFKRIEDFTPENVAVLEEALKGIDPIHGILSDGVTEEDIQELIHNKAQRRSITEENDKQALPMIYNDLIANRMYDDTLGSKELQDFIAIQRDNNPEITSRVLQEIVAPYLKNETEDGTFISRNELGQIVQALRDIIPALKDANTFTIEQREFD